MADWSAFLDKFLRDTELPVLTGAGSISHDEAMNWANEQYDSFAERRRLEAEAMAEARYMDDLCKSAKSLEEGRKRLPAEGKTKPPTREEEDGSAGGWDGYRGRVM